MAKTLPLRERLLSRKLIITAIIIICATVALSMGKITVEVWLAVMTTAGGTYNIGNGLASKK